MRTSLASFFFSIQLFVGCAEVIFRRLTAGQTLSLSCHLQQDHSRPAALHLYHRDSQSQTTVLSVRGDGDVRVDPGRRARTQLHGGLNSQEVNLTISPLELSDTGLYLLELSYEEDSRSDRVAACAPQTLLLVEGSGGSCPCSPRYAPLLLTIFSAAGFLLLILVWLAAEKCLKVKQRHRTRPHVPIYEDMNWKQQRSESPQNNREGPSHLEEVHFPVYANPHRQSQDNYYACPRQLALRASQ
ncbi:uncharacterized protein LOC115387492 [Salarias fasciatus]|uniref:uncharacterized protein LOC115387492 n=1 Tax=Salarias fasciatus TaxID=181472 RepID=UPI001176745E|nr:uncharacterized protein LOC115387492 [Salarias fasciatus]